MKTLIEGLNSLKIPFDDSIINTFEKHMSLTLEWNEKINLTRITEKEDFIKKHYIDSLACYGYPQVEKAQSIIDIGTGAGFPGVPLAIVYPDKDFVLVDSSMKKLKIVEEICKEIDVKNVRVIHGRAEDLARDKDHREQYDFCVSRAVAEISILSEYCLPFVKVGGALGAYKTKNSQEEIRDGFGAIKLLGGKIIGEESLEITNFHLDHLIVMIEKINKTPEKYPRKAGIPKKQPLK